MKILSKNKYNLFSKITKLSFVLLIAFSLVTPLAHISACDPKTDPNCKPDSTGINNIKPDSTGGNGINIKTGINNPLSSELDTIPKFIEKILEIVLLIGVPIVTLAIIYSGFLFVTASGNSEKLKKAKQTLLYTLIGAALLLGSFVISKAIVGTVEEIKSTT